MANNPSVQKKAQEELDRVVGPNRLPLISDRDSLPYVDALVKEVARWNPVVPTSTLPSSSRRNLPNACTGVPRRTSRDDVYEGYFIPKDTVVMPNSWFVADDAAPIESSCLLTTFVNRHIAFQPNANYPPKQFIPERFLDDGCPTVDPSTWAFGFGRR